MSNPYFNVIIQSADGRYLGVQRERVQWVFAASYAAQDAAPFRATPLADGETLLQFSPAGESWDRYLYPNGGPADDHSTFAIWANAPEPGPNTHFKLEQCGRQGYVQIRASNGKLLTPSPSGAVPGHLEAIASEPSLATQFKIEIVGA